MIQRIPSGELRHRPISQITGQRRVGRLQGMYRHKPPPCGRNDHIGRFEIIKEHLDTLVLPLVQKPRQTPLMAFSPNSRHSTLTHPQNIFIASV